MNLFPKHLLITVLALSATTSAFAGNGWLTSYSEAVSQSKKTGKPIMADFTGSDWCGWCIRLHNEVFDKPEFKKWAAKNVVLLELDYPHQKQQSKAIKEQNDKIMRKYGPVVEGFPTVLFMEADGSVFGKYGYEAGGPENWTKMASRLLPLHKTGKK